MKTKEMHKLYSVKWQKVRRKRAVKAFVKVLISSTAWKKYKQDGQYTYNVTLRHVRKTTGAVEKQ
jgi:hypothetical protein